MGFERSNSSSFNLVKKLSESRATESLGPSLPELRGTRWSLRWRTPPGGRSAPSAVPGHSSLTHRFSRSVDEGSTSLTKPLINYLWNNYDNFANYSDYSKLFKLRQPWTWFLSSDWLVMVCFFREDRIWVMCSGLIFSLNAILRDQKCLFIVIMLSAAHLPLRLHLSWCL